MSEFIAHDHDVARGRIAVLGSINLDLVQHVARMPAPGETLAGEELQQHLGGKGANQACAVARLGAQVRLFGAVGNDSFGGYCLQQLTAIGVDAAGVRRCSSATGTAMILVLPDGENSIVISHGANAEVSVSMASEATATLRAGDVLLCQLEIPLRTVEAAFSTARERGAITILDPAPACDLPADFLRTVGVLTPNAGEAAALLGWPAIRSVEECRRTAQELLKRGPESVVLKLGSMGCVAADGRGMLQIPAFPVEAVDTTAAGDAFNGALAVCLAEKQTLARAARFANAAAALSVMTHGASTSMPTRRDVEQFLGTHNARV